jgi:hypothetical protein
VINMNGGAPAVSGRRLGGIVALATGCAVVMLSLLSPAGASASYAKCHGSLAPDNGVNIPDPNGIDYTFYCNHVIHAYTITSSSPVEFFGVSPLVYAGKDPGSSEVDGNSGFSCEGTTPSYGFGCNGLYPPGGSTQGGTLTKNEAVQGQLVTDDQLCGTHHARPKMYFSVVETEYQGGKPFITSSGPFRLKNGCGASAHRHSHRHHPHH